MKNSPDQIAASQFKAGCLALLDRVERTRRPLIVTKRGRAVAKIVPLGRPSRRMKGRLTIVGDIVGPIGEEWNADR